MKKIALTTKKELNIYMNPTRQQLLRQMQLSNTPLTPKMLSDKLQISASSVQHHIKKLLQLELIELDHTEIINGITASFYKPSEVTVQIGLDNSDGLEAQREVLMQNLIAKVYDGFMQQARRRVAAAGSKEQEGLQKWGDIMSGVIHLKEKESDELMGIVRAFIEQHSAPAAGSSAWEYAIIAYKTEDTDNE
jgi:predicted transcriptional regulator